MRTIIIQRRRTLGRVGNVEVDARRTCICKRCRWDAALHGSLLVVYRLVVVVLVLVVMLLADRGRWNCRERRRRRRCAGSRPCEFREVRKRGSLLPQMAMDFVWACRC